MDLQRIGRYDIKSMIGQGGMSAVYLGYDPRSQREVAIKILPPYYLHSTKFRERFEREALMIALLEHPAIVPVYDMGEEEGQPYIVMRYMSGGSLTDKLNRGSIPLRECMEMYIRLAPALDTAHARGVTHRDVKPDNLLFDKYDNVFLSDFGLARLRETIGFANISDGSIIGTPAYMSPEQIQGDREIDGRSDIYSMGVVLYQMLCGSVPFYGTTAASVMMMHLVNPVPQIQEQNKTLPLGIQTVLETAMAKNPDDRYQTAVEFAKAIQAVTTGVHKKPTFRNIETLTSKRPTSRTTKEFPSNHASEPSKPDNHNVVKNSSVNGKPTPVPVKARGARKTRSINIDSTSSESKTPPYSSTSQPETLQKQARKLPWWSFLVGFLVILVLSLAIVLRTLDAFPFAHQSNPNTSPDNALVQNTPGQASLGEAASTTQTSVTLGQADKLAFLKSSDIWISNLDGSNLTQLTTDAVEKSNLHWSPDGQSVLYTSANCIKLVGFLTKQVITLTCFTVVSNISAFDISSDGQDVALGLDQSDLYLLPYRELFNLPQASPTSELLAQAQCSYYAPYHTTEVLKAVKWSSGERHLALLLSRLVQGTYRDEVSILDFSQCAASPQVVEEITPTYFLFTLRGYYDHPEISGFSWIGNQQLLLNGEFNDQGFGDLQLYNIADNQGQELTPNGPCCYRDVHWSPDGTYLFYSFQPETGGDINLYYTPADELGNTGNTMASLALPAGFLPANQESFQLALRTAH